MVRSLLPGAALLLNLALAPVSSAAQTPDRAAAQREYIHGTELEARKQLDEAALAYQQAIRTDPHLAVAHDRLGFVYGLQGRTADAVAQFERARQIDPGLFDAQYHLGATLWWTGEPDRDSSWPSAGNR